MNKDIISSLEKLLGEANVRLDEPMKNHTTFRIGGPAECFIVPPSGEALAEALSMLGSEGVKVTVIGNGSNLLVADEGVRGVVVKIGKGLSDIRREGDRVSAGAGAMLSSVASFAMREGLAGLAFAGGIPGSLGGGCVMNAGAYGGELADCLCDVTVYDRKEGIIKVPAERLCLGYRSSSVIKNVWIVLGATFELKEGKSEEIREEMEGYSRLRSEKQPLEYPSAGSTFKRPEGYFAGKLIMDAGLAGKSIGGAEVSEKHCGFLINKGNATAKDMHDLIRYVRETVADRFGVWLEPEVKFIGGEDPEEQ